MDANGTLLRGEERAENLLAAIDKVVPVIDHQIEKYKGKLTRKGNKNGPSIKSKLDEEPASDIVRTKRFTMKPMSTEDAITQMELLDMISSCSIILKPKNIICSTCGKTASTA